MPEGNEAGVRRLIEEVLNRGQTSLRHPPTGRVVTTAGIANNRLAGGTVAEN